MVLIRTLFFTALIFLSAQSLASVAKSPLDVNGMNRNEAERHLESIEGRELAISGVVKDAAVIRSTSSSILYEIPAYWRNGSQYVKYGIVCQRAGESKIIFADDGYLSQFVKKNALDRPVLAEGKMIEGGGIEGLPKGIVFVIDSLKLQDGEGER